MKLLYSVISWIFAQAFSALVCFIIYNYGLLDLFKINITYLHWLYIIIIIACIVPTKGPHINNNQSDPKSKLDDFVSSLTKKRNDRQGT